MSETALFEMATIIVLGVSAQWLAARLHLPSILLLLLFGFVAGPLTGLVNPDECFGELLFPIVSISVALILYEGGLTLRLVELGKVSQVLRNLLTFGALITWAVSTAAAYLIFDLDMGVAALLGAVLVATGPTVIGPLLRHIRPTGAVGPILKWEGIVIDPIAAVLAVLVFEVISSAGGTTAATQVAYSILRTVVIGGGLGLIGAAVLAFLLSRYWIPDFLQNAVSLMFVVGAFTAANAAQAESGLVAATVMGLALANQKLADVKHIVEFKENLRVLLISALFIILAARLPLSAISDVGWKELLFIAVLVLLGRPLAVMLSTVRSKLRWRERLFLAWVAPRGIVSAAVASLFALRLEEHTGPGGGQVLVTITFLTIIATVGIYGLTAPWVARRLGVAVPNPQGVLLVGAQTWTRSLAALLRAKGFPVLLVDSNRCHTAAARMAGLPTYTGSILAEETLDEINLAGIGRLLAVTPNDWVNALAVQRFTRIFGRAECYQLAPRAESRDEQARHKHLHGRWLFGQQFDYADLARRAGDGARIKATNLTDEFDFDAFRARYGESAVPLCVITEGGLLNPIAADAPLTPQPGQTLISLVQAEPEKPAS